MKRWPCIVIGASILLLGLGLAKNAYAMPFESVINWPAGIGFYENYTYTHVLDLDPPGRFLNSAQLSITHFRNKNMGSREIWFTYSGEDILIGQLSGSRYQHATDTWPLNSDILTQMVSSCPWSLEVQVREESSY